MPGPNVIPGIEHGKPYGYRLGCRCAPCRLAANSQRQAHRQTAARQRPHESASEKWRQRAACKGEPVAIFYPDRGEVIDPRAVALCAGCPVRVECLDYAMTGALGSGYWGGHSELSRRHLRRRQQVAS